MNHDDPLPFAKMEPFSQGSQNIDSGRFLPEKSEESAPNLFETHFKVPNILFKMNDKDDLDLKMEQIFNENADVEMSPPLIAEQTIKTQSTSCLNCKSITEIMSTLKIPLEICKIYQFACQNTKTHKMQTSGTSYDCKECLQQFNAHSSLTDQSKQSDCAFEDIKKNPKKVDSELEVENMNLADLNKYLIEKYLTSDEDVFTNDISSDSDKNNDHDLVRNPFADLKCSQSFAGESKDLISFQNVHSENYHNEDESEEQVKRNKECFTCNECEKSFMTKEKLSRHTLKHNRKSYTCKVCSLKFKTKFLMTSHELSTHQSNTLYTCNDCGKKFSSRRGLRKHTPLHAVASWHFYCEECEKTFTSRQGYVIHKRIHSGERPYHCGYCGKSFKDGGTLKKHERTHTGERPYVCPLCKKAFNQKAVLRGHIKTMHIVGIHADKRGKYHCSLCIMTYVDKKELCDHFVDHSDGIAKKPKAQEGFNVLNVVDLADNKENVVVEIE